MCTGASTPEVEKVASPEPVKHSDAQSDAVRSDAKRKAAASFGTLGTDLTKGQVTGQKKKTFGGE